MSDVEKSSKRDNTPLHSVGSVNETDATGVRKSSSPETGTARRQLMTRIATSMFAAPAILASLEVRADPISAPG